MWRKAICGALILLCVAVAYPSLQFNEHSSESLASFTLSDLWRPLIFAIVSATFITSLMAGWYWEGLLGSSKPKSLLRVFAICVVGFLLVIVGPVVIAARFSKSDAWADHMRSYLMLAILLWQLIDPLAKRRESAMVRKPMKSAS